jgi:heme A synthase
LRIFHPAIAVIVSFYLILVISWITNKTKKEWNRSFGRFTISIIMLQLFAGLINVILLAPVWLQLVHLLLADAVWSGLILFTAATLSIESKSVISEEIRDITLSTSS